MKMRRIIERRGKSLTLARPVLAGRCRWWRRPRSGGAERLRSLKKNNKRRGGRE
jgi:hypothetical protein